MLSWIFAAEENPRGLRFIADRLNEHLAALPEELAPRPVAALRSTAFRLVSRVRLFDAVALAGSPVQTTAFLQEVQMILAEVNDRVTQVYVIHTEASK